MKIHLNQIPSGGTLHVEGEEDRDILDLHDALAQAKSPVRYSLDVGLSGGGLFATGTLSVDLELECVRCLNRFPYTVEVPNFAVQVELTTAETVDLTDEAREDILLVLPPHPHCDWNGATTCAGVLEMQRIQEPEPAAEPEGPNPWATLDQLSKPKDR
ncbi:MAG: hypothetical protein PHQ12_12275 [Chthoniobacteraceae bacterium]|nr:hypothetical protein [Chthoniobacteraceae bacterium]